MRSVFVTGSAGFIGFHLCKRLLEEGYRVAGYDAMTPYYDVTLKERRHEILAQSPNFTATVAPLEDYDALTRALQDSEASVVVHLAAQAGVRYSLEAPRAYADSNLIGTFNILEAVRAHPVDHLLMASTSSVYGGNTEMPFAETQKADLPLTLYAASKKAGEAMSHSYAHLFAIPVTQFRFFTVYGPWGRPDMALFKFVSAGLEGRPIDVYNHGRMARDFTYVADLVQAIRLLIDLPPALPDARLAPALPGDSLSPVAPWRVVNIGNSTPIELGNFITAIEEAIDRPIARNNMEIQPGDVPNTWADTELLHALTGFRPKTGIEEGVRAFVEWYRDYYDV